MHLIKKLNPKCFSYKDWNINEGKSFSNVKILIIKNFILQSIKFILYL